MGRAILPMMWLLIRTWRKLFHWYSVLCITMEYIWCSTFCDWKAHCSFTGLLFVLFDALHTVMSSSLECCSRCCCHFWYDATTILRSLMRFKSCISTTVHPFVTFTFISLSMEVIHAFRYCSLFILSFCISTYRCCSLHCSVRIRSLFVRYHSIKLFLYDCFLEYIRYLLFIRWKVRCMMRDCSCYCIAMLLIHSFDTFDGSMCILMWSVYWLLINTDTRLSILIHDTLRYISAGTIRLFFDGTYRCMLYILALHAVVWKYSSVLCVTFDYHYIRCSSDTVVLPFYDFLILTCAVLFIRWFVMQYSVGGYNSLLFVVPFHDDPHHCSISDDLHSTTF